MKHECEVKVRCAETDALGHVNNVSYFIYLEEARIEFFRELGASLEMGSWKFILASTSCDFKQQAYFDERLTIQSVVKRIGNSSFHLNHEIVSERGLIAVGKEVIVHFDFEAQASLTIPAEMRSKLEKYLDHSEVKGV